LSDGPPRCRHGHRQKRIKPEKPQAASVGGLVCTAYNLCRTHEALRMTPAMALGVTDRVWSVSELIEAALKAVPTTPTPTPAQRRRTFRVIQGDLFD
jgi:hypothetical protein